jgi:hypothetical protein
VISCNSCGVCANCGDVKLFALGASKGEIYASLLAVHLAFDARQQ